MTKSIDHTTISEETMAFMPTYIKVDDRSTQEIIQHFVSYAKQIPFFNENGLQLGYWDKMYTEQILFLWIEILRLDIEAFDSEKKAIFETWFVDGESQALKLLGDILYTLKGLYAKAKRLNALWIEKEITAAIGDSLFDNVDHLLNELDHREEADESKRLQEWRNWLFNEKQSNNLVSLPIEINQEKKSIFQDTINSAINCLYVLKHKLSHSRFEKMLQTGKHPAHIGLLYGFLKSYELIQNQFNQIPKRHLDYYYKKILKQYVLTATPDFAYLFVTLIPKQPFLKLKNNTTFVAGQDENGNDLLFQTTQTFNLSAARITELKTLLFNASEAIVPLNRANMISGLYMDSIAPEVINDNRKNTKGWPICGDPDLYGSNKVLPDIGWAVASPLFFLNAGERTIKLCFELTADSIVVFERLLAKVLRTGTVDQRVHEEEMLYRFLNNAFDLQITSAVGMFSIENYVVHFSEKDHDKTRSLDFQFTLSSNDPGWIATTSAIHGATFASELPLLSIRLKQETVYYPYSFLNRLKLDALKITVDVTNFDDLIVYNKHGIVNTSRPFPILGMNPLKGNAFFVGAKEWQYKRLTGIDCKINWLDLPSPNFKDYYKNYSNQPITDDSFNMSFNDHSTTVNLGTLFSLDSDNQLNPYTVFNNIPVNKLPDLYVSVQSEIISPAQAPFSFVSFKLETPDMGFGSDIYLEEMARYGQKLIKDRKKKTLSIPPQKPFVPMAKSIRVNYRSEGRISLNSNSKTLHNQVFDFFHIHPYGIIKVGNHKTMITNELLPNCDEGGNLYIGLEAALPLTELSMFMKLIPSRESLQNESTTFHYLSGKFWRVLPPENVIENSTNDCQETGVIRLMLPADLKSDHAFFDKKKNWLRISYKSKALSALGRCIYINTNVIKVTRNLDNNNTVPTRLEPLSISGPFHKNKFIQSVIQPFRSFNGSQKETDLKFYMRVSNRLGHKNRMVRPRDYKRMVLEKFTEINWVKVLTPSKYPKRIAPGSLQLIVMPRIKNLDDFSSYFAPKQTRKEIREYLLEHCMPGLNVTVASPNYEVVEVRCALKPKAQGVTTFKNEVSDIIRRQIAPWLFHNGVNYKKVTTRFSVGNLIDKINKHPNVEDVYTCQVIRISKVNGVYSYFDSVTDGDIIAPSDEKGVLIPALQFEIDQVASDDNKEEELALGTMEIGSDLILEKATQKELMHKTIKKDPLKKRYFISLKI